MNFTVLNVVVFGAGAILIYSAIRNVDPKDVVMAAFTGDKPSPRTQPQNEAPAPAEPPRTVPAIYPSV